LSRNRAEMEQSLSRNLAEMEQKWSRNGAAKVKYFKKKKEQKWSAESKSGIIKVAKMNSRIKKAAEMRCRITGSSSLEADGISGVSEEKPVTNRASLVSLKRPGNGSLVLPTNHCFCLIISLWKGDFMRKEEKFLQEKEEKIFFSFLFGRKNWPIRFEQCGVFLFSVDKSLNLISVSWLALGTRSFPLSLLLPFPSQSWSRWTIDTLKTN